MRDLKKLWKWDRYAKIEIGFFVILCVIMPMFSDLEYSLNEAPAQFSNNYYDTAIIRRIVWGIFTMIPYYVFYKLAIQGLLIRKKYVWFLVALLGFILLYEIYMVYVMYNSIAHMSFLPDVMIKEARQWMKQNTMFHFTIHYLVLKFLEMIALAYFINYDKQEKTIRELQRIQSEADLQYLKAQLQPHFFFNTLNNIYSLALQRSELTAPLVAKLSSMMRYVLYDASRNDPTLQDELAFLQDYMDVQSVRYKHTFDFSFEVQVADREIRMEPLLLFPFIENAYKHGIEEETEGGYIKVVICLNGNDLILSVRNSKTAKAAAHTKGIGIENTRKRLTLLYPGKHELLIEETVDAYAVLLTLTID